MQGALLLLVVFCLAAAGSEHVIETALDDSSMPLPPVDVYAIVDDDSLEDDAEDRTTRALIKNGVVQAPFNAPPGAEVFRGLVAVQCSVVFRADIRCDSSVDYEHDALPEAVQPNDLDGVATSTLDRFLGNNSLFDINFRPSRFHRWVSRNLEQLTDDRSKPTHLSFALRLSCRDRRVHEKRQQYRDVSIFLTKHFLPSHKPDVRNEKATWSSIAALFVGVVLVNVFCYFLLLKSIELRASAQKSSRVSEDKVLSSMSSDAARRDAALMDSSIHSRFLPAYYGDSYETEDGRRRAVVDDL